MRDGHGRLAVQPVHPASTRGSCESLVSIMMLTVLHGLLSNRVAFAAAVYAATHLRIYP